MADTEHEVEIKHNLDEYAKKIKESNDLWDAHFAKIKAVNEELAKVTGASLRGKTSRTMENQTPTMSTSDRNLMREYQRSFIPYARASIPVLRAGLSLAAGTVRGGFNMAFGGGLSGFASGLSTELKRAFSGGNNNIYSQLFGGAAMGAAKRRGFGGAAVAGGEEEIVEAVAKGAETGIGFGLIQGLSKLGGVAKLGIGALIAGTAVVAGVDLVAVDKSMRDVYGRSRRAGGFGSNLGELTAFDATMGRFVDTNSVMSKMTQGKYDFTSPEYLSLKLAGINPKDWKDPAAMGEAAILSVQRQIKQYPQEKMLPLAHARFGDLFSDEEYVRLYNAREGEVTSMIKLAQAHKDSLDLTEQQQTSFKDLATNVDLVGNQLKALGEDLLSHQIPAFEKLTKIIIDLIEKYSPNPDIPSESATPKAFMTSNTGGGGVEGFKVPGGYEGVTGAPGSKLAGAAGATVSGDAGGTGGSFLDSLAQIESGNRNIFSGTDPDVAGPGSRSQGFFQINTPTWRDFAPGAGVDLSKYPNARSAPRDVQAQVASRIPFSRFGPRTQTMMRSKFGALNPHLTIGDLAKTHGTGYNPVIKSNVGANAAPGDDIETMRKKGLLTSDQCVALAMAGVGVGYGSSAEGGHTGDWRRGEAASAGGLVPGTPISTFLDRQGRTGETYAIGGHGGQMGANLDHAGIFEGYIRKDGKITGMNVKWQARGIAPHMGQYYFGQGRGEQDASNYFGIDVASGGHLGGAANPMSHRYAGGGIGKQSLNDMSSFQQHQGIHVKVSNPAGATVNTQTAMLGAVKGAFA
jgi:hypothetical protein